MEDVIVSLMVTAIYTLGVFTGHVKIVRIGWMRIDDE